MYIFKDCYEMKYVYNVKKSNKDIWLKLIGKIIYVLKEMCLNY